MERPLNKFITDQLSVWPLAAANFRGLKNARTRTLTIGGLDVVIQCNPGRIASSIAETDAETLASRPCFLCEQTRPREQRHVRFEGRKGRRYNIQVNPYPIFPRHLVIARNRHVDQSIWHCFVDMLDLTRKYQEYTFFYNGPCSGASAPDHMHFQAAPKGQMPLENAVNEALDLAEAPEMRYLTSVQDADLFHFRKFTTGVFALRARTAKSMAKLFYRLLDCVPVRPGEKEPRFNLFAWSVPGGYRAICVLRSEVRSHHYTSQGPDHLTMSIGCADIAGFFICPVESEFERLDEKTLAGLLGEVSVSAEQEADVIWRLTRTQQTLEVGILSAGSIRFEIISDGAGPQMVSYEAGRINYNGALYDELLFDAVTPSSLFAEPSFILYDVRIGKDFHWERTQMQRFAGALKFIVEDGQVVAVNRVGIEDYLVSVISSEMRPTASLEFLKAHAVISRSWVLSQIGRRPAPEDPGAAAPEPAPSSEDLIIKWFDHSEHKRFDVCADDHCQRYQGLTKSIGAVARKAVDDTWGQVLTYDGQLCDARFSKCCGGTTELFSSCWGDFDLPYLASVRDCPEEGGDPFCKTQDRGILSQVLNDYDLETEDFFDWRVRYSAEELSEMVRERSGVDFGEIRSLTPLRRGPSGRISMLRIEGSRHTAVVGKELLIRRYLSPSHLKSSAFEVSRDGADWVLDGRGWGHGVGLCQIGAAVMATRGYTYDSILRHYYRGAQISRL